MPQRDMADQEEISRGRAIHLVLVALRNPLLLMRRGADRCPECVSKP